MRKTDTSHCPGVAGRPRCPGKQVAILKAALTLLAEQGFTRMTLDRVARAAGVSKATIHLRWKTKADLAAAALEALRPCVAPAPADEPHAAVATLLDDFAQVLTQHHGMALTGTCLAEESHTPQLLSLFREHAVLPRRAALCATLAQGVASGDLSADADLEALTSALLGSFYADHLAGRTTSADWARRTVDTVLGPWTERTPRKQNMTGDPYVVTFRALDRPEGRRHTYSYKIESAPDDIVALALARDLADTPTERAARGGLRLDAVWYEVYNARTVRTLGW